MTAAASVTIARARGAGELGWWLNAVLRHAVSPDEALRCWGSASVQLLEDGGHTGAPVGWALALAPLRGAGVDHLDVYFVEPGDPLGLPGPGEVIAAAVEAGVAIVGGHHAFVPVGPTNRWRDYPAAPRPTRARPLGSVPDARQLMRTAMAELTAALPALDPDDEALAEITELRSCRGARPPHGVRVAAAQTANDALRVWWLTLIARGLAERRGLPVPPGVTTLRPLARRAAAVAFSEPVTVAQASA